MPSFDRRFIARNKVKVVGKHIARVRESTLKLPCDASSPYDMRRMVFAKGCQRVRGQKCTRRFVDYQQKQHPHWPGQISALLAISSGHETVLSSGSANLDGTRLLRPFPDLARLAALPVVAAV